jgi:hypothetical protein
MIREKWKETQIIVRGDSEVAPQNWTVV